MKAFLDPRGAVMPKVLRRSAATEPNRKMGEALHAAAAFLCASARNCLTCPGFTVCRRVVAIAGQFNPFSFPDIGGEGITRREAPLELERSEDSVVDLTA
jgi:hypothetical protein